MATLSHNARSVGSAGALLTLVLFSLLSLTTLTGCGSGPDFRISGQVEGMGTRNLRFVYRANGALQQAQASALDGKFQMQGRAKEPTLVEIFTSTGTLIGRAIAGGGDDIQLKLVMGNPMRMEVQGSDQTKLLAGFMRDNQQALASRQPAAVNRAVERFVAAHRRDLAAAVVLQEFYDFRHDPQLALALLDTLDLRVNAEAMLAGLDHQLRDIVATPADSVRLPLMRLMAENDSACTLDARQAALTLLVLTDAKTRLADTLRSALARLRATHTARELAVVDIACDADTAAWHESLRTLRGDISGPSASGIRRVWAPAAAATPGLQHIPVERYPTYILADSTTRVLAADIRLPKIP